MSPRLTDLDPIIEDIPHNRAEYAWNRPNIIAEAFINEGWHVTINRTTYAPVEEDAE